VPRWATRAQRKELERRHEEMRSTVIDAHAVATAAMSIALRSAKHLASLPPARR